MKDSSLTPEQVACVYAWLAQLFSRERDDESLEQLHSSEMAEWFALLKSEPSLEAEVLLLEEKLRRLRCVKTSLWNWQLIFAVCF